MLKNRIKIRHLLESQLPDFLKEGYEDFVSFLTEYYNSLESLGSPLDILNNIDGYVKLENISELIFSTSLVSDLDTITTSIEVDSTQGFPNNYGLIQIDDEIILYESKSETKFINCTRGFSGITSYKSFEKDSLVFSETSSDYHTPGKTVFNLSTLFLTEVYNKFKSQYAPGFDTVKFYEGVNEKVLVSRIKDFYAAKGTNSSFKILFKAIFGTEVEVIKPRDFVIQASDADYRITRDLVVESLIGNPENLVNLTLFQDESNFIPKASGSVTNVEKIYRNNKNYYQISLDYNPDIEVFKFSIHPRTKIVSDTLTNQTFIDVDSTLGFPNSGVLVVYIEGIEHFITYTSKSSTQFFGCSNVIEFKRGTDILTPDYAYGIDNDGNEIRVKITGVLSDLQIPDNTKYCAPDDEVQIISLGLNGESVKENDWLFNVGTSYVVESITQLTQAINGAARFRVKTYDNNIFVAGDPATLILNNGQQFASIVISTSDLKSFDINISSNINLNSSFIISRGIVKASSLNYPELRDLSAGIQNTYIDKDDTYITSPSIPSYYNTPLIIKNLSVSFSGIFNGDTLEIGDNPFYTGDAVYYQSGGEGNTLNIPESLYFIKKESSSRIKLATSRSNISNNIFLFVNGVVTNNKFDLFRFADKTVKSQKLIRKISPPINDSVLTETLPGQIGILKNGVEILNYKSNDIVHYGPLEKILVSSSGDQNYDVVNPPILHIEDKKNPITSQYIGSGATGVCNVIGSLKKINIIDRGYDYLSEPNITIIGGNGSGARAKCNLSAINQSLEFSAGSEYNQVDLVANTIGFSTYHKLRSYEKIVYKSQNQTEVGGIINNSIYYVDLVDAYKIRLHKSYQDALSGINTINLSSFGIGVHKIDSFDKKNVISSIEVLDPGSDYSNKILYFTPQDVNTYKDTLNIKDHNLKNKDIVIYNTTSTIISGLSTSQNYYVKVLDKDNIRLSLVGIGTSLPTDYYYNTNKFVSFESTGFGVHSISYPPIEVKIEGPIGVSTLSGQDFSAKIQAIFRGKVDSISLSNYGQNYGEPNILNYNRTPSITLLNGKNALLTPIVSTSGKVINVIINNPGENYYSIPDLIVVGSGFGCTLTPIIKNGKIISVNVINGGSNYDPKNTFIKIVPAGSEAKFEPKITQWHVNLVERLINSNQITPDDGILSPGLNSDYELQYCHGYAPRELRKQLLSTTLDTEGQIKYRQDLLNDDFSEKYHSPIIGWSYDGNPIYGPYGYTDVEGGFVKRMRSGYELRLSTIRPSGYTPGFFVEDYVFVGSGDLDIHNGRYCKTPEFPNGVYAYFSTINNTKDASGPFINNLKPVFPYLIGNYYKSVAIDFNFNRDSNQDKIDINQTNWSRNVFPYSLLSTKTFYDGVVSSDKESQKYATISSIKPGSLEELKIVFSGDNYSVSDSIFFDNQGTGGSGAYAKIKEIKGKTVNRIDYNLQKIPNVNFITYSGTTKLIGFSTQTHTLTDGDIVSLQNINDLNLKFDNSYRVNVKVNKLNLSRYLPNSSVTGIITYINVSGNLSYPDFTVNDVLGIGTERIKILEIDNQSSRLKIRREIDSTVGTSHSEGAVITEIPRKFYIEVGYTTSTNYLLNKELYFDPKESISIFSENLLTYSSPTNSSPWSVISSGAGSTINVSYYNQYGLDNSLSAAKVTIGSSITSSRTAVLCNGTVSLASTNYTASVFLKGEEGNEIVYLVLENGIDYVSQSVKLTKNWQRYSVTGSTNAGAHNFKIGGIGNLGYTIPAGTFYVYGAQIESGSTTSPFIKTTNSIVVRSDKKVGFVFKSNPGFNEINPISIPAGQIYIPKHGLKTGDTIVYRNNQNTSIKVSNATTSYLLQNNTPLFVAKYNDEFIGVSTELVGIGSTGTFVGLGTTSTTKLLEFSSYGSGLDHSFVTNFSKVITADVYNKKSIVQTTPNHNLQVGDYVDVAVVSGIQTTVTIKYSDSTRRLLVNPRSFISSDVNVTNNTINIPNHGYKMSEKILHTSSSSSGGLQDGEFYYVVFVDENTIKLSLKYFVEFESEDQIEIVNITSASFGTFTQINPEIILFKNSKVTFDLSDESLSSNGFSAFDFDLFLDSNFKNKFYNTIENDSLSFNVQKIGAVGSSGARLVLSINEYVPQNLYYNLVPLTYSGSSLLKTEIIIDDVIKNHNRITILNSKFSTKSLVIGVTTNTFTYGLSDTPERPFYTKSDASLIYSTSSNTAKGPIDKVSLESYGRYYNNLPSISEITTGIGTNAILLPISKTIGKVNDYTIKDIGFNYPVDVTLKPSVYLPITYKIEPLSRFKTIKVTSPGINYFIAPQLIVLDGLTGRLNDEVDLRYESGDTEVNIVRNTSGLYNVNPKILPVNNPNGVRISSISYNQATSEVTVGLAITYSNANQFPFSVGEKVIVENTNIDINEGGKGFNSANYNYTLFTLTQADANIGFEEPILKYKLTGLLGPGEDPGTYDPFESFGTVTPEKYFPIFDVTLEKDVFREGEIVYSENGNNATVIFYDEKNEYLRVRSKSLFKLNDLIIGDSSGNKGVISLIESSKGFFNIGSNSITKKGFKKQTGYLNSDLQRIHDNDYYQYFSYSLKSSVNYSNWNSLVSSLNHTAGFKKFAQLDVSSYDVTISGIGTEQNLGFVESITDISQEVDLNCIKDFDVAKEKSILIDDSYVSNEIIFRLPFLQKYQEFIGNRVLKIDDLSSQFDDKTTSFNLYSNNYPIFKVDFYGNATDYVKLEDNIIDLRNHYFVSGEEIEYIPPNNNFGNAIGIATTTVSGIGLTDKLPPSVYVVKVDNQKIQLASSPQNALLFNPIVYDLTSVGIGSTHTFKSKNTNTRLLITVNNVIQSPIVSTAITSSLNQNVGIATTSIILVGISSLFGGDLIKINDEVMRITSIDSSTNKLNVVRSTMGTVATSHTSGNLVTKYTGNYNVVDNVLNFPDPIWGKIPVGFGTTAASPNEVDYSGLTTSSRFSGRVFLRSALNQAFTTSYVKAYDTNYVFDDVSQFFNGITTQFTLKRDKQNVVDVAQGNAIVLINNVFQGPQRLGNALTDILGDYKLTESGGSTILSFTGKTSNVSQNNDINVSNVPKGGVIVSVGSTNGLGYQPLVAAGGTARVSVAGTISSISIGNSGSGYRVGIQTLVRVGVQTYSNGTPKITYVGYATVFRGNVVSPVIITNPGSGFTSTNPPQVIFDNPLSYTSIPLIYSSSSPSGVGTGAKVDIVVGQGSSVINFEITNYGYGYGQGDILTIPFGGTTGIPTTSAYQYKEFRIFVDKTYQSQFSSWSVGDLLVLDNIERFFNGRRKLFPLSRNGERISFFARRNSGIDLQSNLLVFVNDILQVPGEGYTFTGGSVLRFTEAPKGGTSGISTIGDKCKIMIYTGTQTIDVKQVDTLQTIKIGDDVQLYSDFDETLNQNKRLVVDINAADSIITNNYAEQGVSPDELLERPISWCKQTVDKLIDENEVGKDRIYYEPALNPTTNIIQSVGIGSTVVFVKSIRPFFDNPTEAIETALKNTIEIISQDNIVSASATCSVTSLGVVNNIYLNNPGFGYTIAPKVTIQSPGIGTALVAGVAATATSLISSSGIVTSITINSGGSGYVYGPLRSMSTIEQGQGFPQIDTTTSNYLNARLKTKTGVGKNATATIQVDPNNYSVTSINITNSGYDYKVGDRLIVEIFDNVGLATTFRKWALSTPIEFVVTSIKPPLLLIEPPSRKKEEISNISYSGDYGDIVGVGTTSFAGVSTGITFDMFIPLSSPLRSNYAIYESGISTGYYFSVTNSLVGFGITSLNNGDNTLSIGSTCLDNVFEVISTSKINRYIPSIGISTFVIRVVTKVSSFNGLVGFATTSFYGNFDWGRIDVPVRTSPIKFDSLTNKFSGISTNPIVRRQNPLKFFGYFS